VFRQLSHGESEPASLPDRLHGAVLVGLPLATGLCPADGCTRWQSWWGPLYLVLLLAAAALAILGLCRPGTPLAGPAAAGPLAPAAEAPAVPPGGAGSPLATRIGYVAQLALVVGAALTVVAYARNALAATAPLATARYLSVLQIALPAVLWPLWVAARAARRPPAAGAAVRAGARLIGGLAAAVLAACTALMIFSTAVLIGQVGTIRDEERDARNLAATTRRAGIRYTYGEYWTCNRLIFYSAERVVCAVLGASLRPGQNRYDAYPTRVGAARSPAFIFKAGDPADLAFQRYLRRQRLTVPVTEVADYRIYRPDTAIRPWR
jgi:hypothetical protein